LNYGKAPVCKRRDGGAHGVTRTTFARTRHDLGGMFSGGFGGGGKKAAGRRRTPQRFATDHGGLPRGQLRPGDGAQGVTRPTGGAFCFIDQAKPTNR